MDKIQKEIKFCNNKVKERECGIVYTGGTHRLAAFGNLEVDHSLLFVSADTTSQLDPVCRRGNFDNNAMGSIESVEKAILNPTGHLSEQYGLLCIQAIDIEKVKQMLNDTAHDFLSGKMKNFQTKPFFGLYALRHLDSGNSILFMYNNSRFVNKTLLDHMSGIFPYFETKDFLLKDQFISFSSTNTSFYDSLSTVSLLFSQTEIKTNSIIKETEYSDIKRTNRILKI